MNREQEQIAPALIGRGIDVQAIVLATIQTYLSDKQRKEDELLVRLGMAEHTVGKLQKQLEHLTKNMEEIVRLSTQPFRLPD
jgi:CO dehydrogenase/acetyl-CoA synthase epsilon subunit